MTEFISPIARLVQGSMSLETKNDPTTGKPKLDENGQPIKEQFMAIAIRKDDPQLGAFYALFDSVAKAEFPHLFDAAGNCTHPRFANKWQDGDGVDQNGKSVADKPGWAGHWIVKMSTRYPPKCFHAGKYDPSQQIQNPDEVIKRGYFVRVAGTIRGNGVGPQERSAVPGLFVSPNLVELVAFGEEIVGGPDASKVFGGAPVAGQALPPGASATPVGGGSAPAPGGMTPPPLPGGSAAPAPAAPASPAVASPAPGNAAPPPPAAPPAAPPPPAVVVPQGPVMTAKAQGVTYDAMIANGWTDATLREHGYMV